MRGNEGDGKRAVGGGLRRSFFCRGIRAGTVICPQRLSRYRVVIFGQRILYYSRAGGQGKTGGGLRRAGAASWCISWHSYYEKLGYEKGLCPNAEKYYNEVMSIPLYYGLTDEDVEDVIHAVKKVVAYYTKLK